MLTRQFSSSVLLHNYNNLSQQDIFEVHSLHQIMICAGLYRYFKEGALIQIKR